MKITIFLITSEQIENDTVYQYIILLWYFVLENMDIVVVRSILLIISSKRKNRFKYS